MTIGDVFALDARQPDDFAQAQVSLQFRFDLRLSHVWITVAVDPGTLGQDRSAITIYFDTAALARQLAGDVGGARQFAQFVGHVSVIGVSLLIAPTVEVEIH